MSIGKKIKFFRKRRGMTQRALGTEVGFPPASADVRIAQYESGNRTPKRYVLNVIANVLGVSPLALSVPEIEDDLVLLHTLFALEDHYGLKLFFDGTAMYARLIISAKRDTPLYAKLKQDKFLDLPRNLSCFYISLHKGSTNTYKDSEPKL